MSSLLMESSSLNQFNRTTKNVTMDDCAYSTLDQPSVRAAFIITYILVFACCSGGNFLLLIVVGVHPAMRTVTNFFLANLAVADLLVALFCVVQNLLHLFVFEQALWPLGEFMCKMYVFVMHLIPCTSAGLLLALSCERYIAILHPIAARSLLTKRRLALTAAIVWGVSVSTNVPYFMAADYRQFTELVNTSDGPSTTNTLAWCGRAHRGIDQRIMLTFSFVVWYVLPFLAMLVIYTIIGVALWRSTSGHSVVLTSSTGPRKGRPQGGDHTYPLSRQMSSGTASNSTVRIDEGVELVSVTSGADSERMKRHPQDESARSRADNRRNLSNSRSINERMNPSTGLGAEMREAVESRKRVVRLLISIILVFAVLTLPNHTRLLWNVWSPPRRRCNHGFQAVVQPLSYLLLFSNSGINPILYAFMSKKFRLAVSEVFRRKALREQRRERFLTSIRSTATEIGNVE